MTPNLSAVKKPVGLTPTTSALSVLLPRIYTGTWFQDLERCLGNEKSHGKGESQVWSFNSITDNIQQVQNLNRGEKMSIFRRC